MLKSNFILPCLEQFSCHFIKESLMLQLRKDRNLSLSEGHFKSLNLLSVNFISQWLLLKKLTNCCSYSPLFRFYCGHHFSNFCTSLYDLKFVDNDLHEKIPINMAFAKSSMHSSPLGIMKLLWQALIFFLWIDLLKYCYSYISFSMFFQTWQR